MSSRLKGFIKTQLLPTANMFQKKTIVVEGKNDIYFFSQWKSKFNEIRFTDACGKEEVIKQYKEFIKNNCWVRARKVFFCIDVDWDFVTEKGFVNKEFFMLNSASLITNEHFYNDLETFLINTVALEKVLTSLDQYG